MQDTPITEEETPEKQPGISRRTLLKIAGAGAGAAALATPLISHFAADAASTFIKGADISWAPQMEALGYKFYNAQGVQQDILTILQGYGINAIRLRTFVNPSNSPQNGHCSQSETIAMALRCKNAGMKVDIDFMFGDTWNSVGGQNTPAAWANMAYPQLHSALYHYVRNFVNDAKAKGFTPDWMQIGNEENSGICHPVGSLSSHPDQMSGLLHSAYHAIKQTFPSTQVIIHLAQPQKLAVIEHFFDTYKSYGGAWDITGFSSYGSGSEIPGIVANMATAQARYGKPVMQVEFGGPVGRPTQVARDLAAYVKGVKSFGGLGVFYWAPEGYAPFTDYQLGAWDAKTKRPNGALNGFLNS